MHFSYWNKQKSNNLFKSVIMIFFKLILRHTGIDIFTIRSSVIKLYPNKSFLKLK